MSGANAARETALRSGAAQPRQVVEMSAIVAGRHYGCSRDAIVRLVEMGRLEGGWRQAGSRKHWYVLVSDLTRSLRDIFLAHVASNPPLPDVAAMRRFDEFRVLAGCGDIPLSKHWIDSHFALPNRYEGRNQPQEVRAVLTASDVEVSRISHELELREDNGRVYAERRPVPAGDLRLALIDALEEDVPPLDFTWLHPKTGIGFPAIDAAACARLLSMPKGIGRSVAIVHVASAAANGEMIQQSVQALSHDRIDVILDGVDPEDDEEIAARWTAFFRGETMPGVGLAARIRTYSDYLSCDRTFFLFEAEPVSAELKAWLRENRPRIPDIDEFHTTVRELIDGSVAGGLERRHERSDIIADAFDDHAAEAEAAVAEAMLLTDWAQKEHCKAKADEVRTYSVPVPLRDARRRDTGKTMLVDMMSMRVGDLIDALTKKAKASGEELTGKSFLRRHGPDGDRFDNSISESRVTIYLGSEALNSSGPSDCQPYMMKAFQVGATLPPGMLPDAIVEQRSAYLAERNLPTPVGRPKRLIGGLTAFDRNLMVWALRFGIVIYPDQSFAQGVAIGNLFYRTNTMNHARGGTAIQIVDDRAKWGKVKVEGRKLPYFWSTPKMRSEAEKQVLDEKTPGSFKRLIKLTLSIEGTGDRTGEDRRRLPVVEPSADHPKGCGPDRYGMQAGGRALNVANVSYCTSFLFMRLVLTNDPRHAGANQIKRDGGDDQDVADGLGHKSRTTGRGYSANTATERREKGGGRHILLRDALEKLGMGDAS